MHKKLPLISTFVFKWFLVGTYSSTLFQTKTTILLLFCV